MAVIQLIPLTDRGRELLGELERWTSVFPFKTHAEGGRTYSVDGGEVTAFDQVLDRLEPQWEEHLSRVAG